MTETKNITKVNGILFKVDDEIRLHKIHNHQIQNIFFTICGSNIEIDDGYILFVRYKSRGANISFQIITYIDYVDIDEEIYENPEFYELVSFILHRMSESLLIR